jgi:hypothetical protein
MLTPSSPRQHPISASHHSILLLISPPLSLPSCKQKQQTTGNPHLGKEVTRPAHSPKGGLAPTGHAIKSGIFIREGLDDDEGLRLDELVELGLGLDVRDSHFGWIVWCLRDDRLIEFAMDGGKLRCLMNSLWIVQKLHFTGGRSFYAGVMMRALVTQMRWRSGALWRGKMNCGGANTAFGHRLGADKPGL